MIIKMRTWNVETEVIFLLLLLIETSFLSTILEEEIFLTTLLILFLGMNSRIAGVFCNNVPEKKISTKNSE